MLIGPVTFWQAANKSVHPVLKTDLQDFRHFVGWDLNAAISSYPLSPLSQQGQLDGLSRLFPRYIQTHTHTNVRPEHGKHAGMSICEAFAGGSSRTSSREKLAWVSKHRPMVYWNAGKRLACEVMSCHSAPPIGAEVHRLIGVGS